MLRGVTQRTAAQFGQRRCGPASVPLARLLVVDRRGGTQRRITDDLVFDGVRFRVDICTCQAPRCCTLKRAAAYGLWHVAVVKAGTARFCKLHRLARLCSEGRMVWSRGPARAQTRLRKTTANELDALFDTARAGGGLSG